MVTVCIKNNKAVGRTHVTQEEVNVRSAYSMFYCDGRDRSTVLTMLNISKQQYKQAKYTFLHKYHRFNYNVQWRDITQTKVGAKYTLSFVYNLRPHWPRAPVTKCVLLYD